MRGRTSRSRGVSDEYRALSSASSVRSFSAFAVLVERRVSTACSSASSLKGFVRKSSAPALIARTVEGMSP